MRADVIVQVWFHYCFKFFNRLHPISVSKIVGITCTIYQELPTRLLCNEYVGRNVKNASGVNLHQNCLSTYSFLLRLSKNWFEPTIKSENTTTSKRSTKKIKGRPRWALHLSQQYGHVILVSGCTPYFDNYQLIITRTSNNKWRLCNNPSYSRIWLVLAYDLFKDRGVIDVIIS